MVLHVQRMYQEMVHALADQVKNSNVVMVPLNFLK